MLVSLSQFNTSRDLQLKLLNTGSDILVFSAEATPLGIDYSSHVHSGYHTNENWPGSALTAVLKKRVCLLQVFIHFTINKITHLLPAFHCWLTDNNRNSVNSISRQALCQHHNTLYLWHPSSQWLTGLQSISPDHTTSWLSTWSISLLPLSPTVPLSTAYSLFRLLCTLEQMITAITLTVLQLSGLNWKLKIYYNDLSW